jgi:hypothetical protein
MQLYSQGYKYILVCPQAYVSWSKGMKRFRPELVGFLNFIVNSIPPVKTFDHFDEVVLERFVFDHNENLKRSLEFLNSSKEKRYGELRIYDIGQILAVVDRYVGIKNIKLNPEYKADRPSDKYGR